MTVECKSPVLFVADLAMARAFYEDLLDQQVEFDFGVNVGYEAGFALWLRSHAEPIIYGQTPSAPSPTTPAPAAFEMYFEADDVSGLWRKMQEAGIKSIHEIREQPWGQRVFRVYDPDGNVVEVAEPMPEVIARLLREGLTLTDAAARTGMPVEAVHQIAAQAHDPTLGAPGSD